MRCVKSTATGSRNREGTTRRSSSRELRALSEHDRRFGPLSDRLGLLGGKLSPSWRLLIARPPIEECEDAECPKRWENLQATKDHRVRSCSTCGKNVHFAF